MTVARLHTLCVLAASACVWLIAPQPLAQQQTSDDSRASPSGPYRSRMRIVEEGSTIAPRDAEAALEALRDDPYGSTLLLRNLGYAAVASGDEDTAVRRLVEALEQQSLAPIAQAELRADLIRLWARGDDDEALAAAYADWRAAGHDFAADAHLAAARAFTRSERYEQAATALDHALADNDSVPIAWRELQVFVLTRLQRYAQAAAAKTRLLDAASASRDDWLQLAALYQASGNENATLAVMELGDRHAALDRPSDIERLVLLNRRAGLPDYAARVLAHNLALGVLGDTAGHWLSLAEAHIAAHDDEAALVPLTRAAGLASDPQVLLQLGRLHFRLRQYADAIDVLNRALRRDLGSEQGRALLLLGEGYVETGALRRARSAFRKAAEIGGSYLDAQAWLDRLAEERSIADAATSTSEPPPSPRPTDPPTTVAALPIKTVHRQRFYYTAEQADFGSLPAKSVEMARRLRNSVRRERLSASGPLQFIVLADPLKEPQSFELQVGIPVRTRVAPRGIFRNRDTQPFLCVHREFLGDPAALGGAWAALAADALAAGYRQSGESRTVVLNFAAPGEPLLFELQFGILADAHDEI